MFEIDKSFAHANISRTIRFTEPLFYELKALAEKEICLLIILFFSAALMRFPIMMAKIMKSKRTNSETKIQFHFFSEIDSISFFLVSYFPILIYDLDRL